MRLKLKKFEVSAGRPIIFLNQEDARVVDINVGDRVQVSLLGKKIIGRVDILKDFLKKGEISLSDDIVEYIKVKPGSILNIDLVSRPSSAKAITSKMNKKILRKFEIRMIIEDIVNNALTEAEVAQFIVAVYLNGMTKKETLDLTEAMYKTGQVLKWNGGIVADKHSIGGIAGNRTTPIVVSICTAAGIIMPKTSSRAITSAAGTADVIETLAKVDFPAEELKKIVKKVGGCLAWGGSLGLAPADDKLIRVERVLKLDPESQLLASIMSKKLAVGSNHVLIDIPYGPGAKVTKQKAKELKKRFIEIANHFKIKIKVLLTDGSQPIGNGIGPILEMIDILKLLRREKTRPLDLEKKSVMLAGQILEMTGKAKSGEGTKRAQEILDSGEAYKKFEEILNAQGRKKARLAPAENSFDIVSENNGKIREIDSKGINYVAAVLGCPIDKRSGIYLYKHKREMVKKGESIATLYAESTEKLNEAIKIFKRERPIKIV